MLNMRSSGNLILSKAGLIPRLLAIFVPAVYALYLVLNAGQIPGLDYWGILEKVFSIQGFSDRWADWLINQNGHIILIPRVIYALNIFITHGSNLGLSLITWLFALLQTILLVRLLPAGPHPRWLTICLIFCISIFTFTPSAAHIWVHGFSGVAWVGANLLAVASIACLTFYLHDDRIGWIFGSMFFALVAVFTYGTSLVLWMALSIGALLVRPRLWPVLLYLGLTILYLLTTGLALALLPLVWLRSIMPSIPSTSPAWLPLPLTATSGTTRTLRSPTICITCKAVYP
jgi:hypothetical protein